ncbi:MAG TPA: prolyl oligopeptidase family serine peptidase, partial [Actinomycetota bacterium]|nr:prolyl oligopeptidase family serine peptidase [Actinomycetota bacterium]
PASTFELDMATGETTLLKQQPVPNYDASLYESERTWATAPDGTPIPVSLMWRRGLERDGRNPLWLYGYGSYGSSREPDFSAARISLLDRGFVFAIAHVRGGGELGERWHDGGKLLNKRNSFTDFIACAEHLASEGYTRPGRIVAHGGSAGGLLVGAVANMRPDLFGAVVADVPFVDVVSSILDPKLPLSVMEYGEWGNPNEEEFYRYMKSYSPYDNVEAKDYPPMLVLAGLNDPRVSYFEPAKWVAKLRATKTDSNRLLLRTEMGAGHMGPSGRYDAIRETAMIYAFVLDELGVAGDDSGSTSRLRHRYQDATER